MKILGNTDKERVRRIAERVNSSSNADFVKRLLEEKLRTIRNSDGSVSSHELGYRVDDDGNAVVYPGIQSAGLFGKKLKRYEDEEAFKRALRKGDTLMMSAPDAELYTAGYKEAYPSFYPYLPQYDLGPYQSNVGWEAQTEFNPSPEVEQIVEAAPDLFSEEALERRALKQRYAESGFRDNAVSKAGARGAYQIMPITYQDYLGRGKGKAGNLDDPNYSRKVRDWVMSTIPKSLGEFYSEDDAPEVRLAKIYGAYNWGAGNMRKYLRKQREKGVDIAKDTSWVEGLNPETKRYIKYLALDQDIENSPYTNEKFEAAAKKAGYMADGGGIHIAPSKRGTFTAAAKKHGKSVQAFASQVLAHKENYSPAMVRKANFARNAAKWHNDGGLINKYDGIVEPTGQMDRVPNWVVRGSDYSEWKPSQIQDIIDWGYTNPDEFFGDVGKSTRDALSRAGMADSVIGDIYANMSPELQAKYGDRYKGTAQRQQQYNQGIRDYALDASKKMGLAMAGSLGLASGLYYLPEIAAYAAALPSKVAGDMSWLAANKGLAMKAAATAGVPLLAGSAVEEGVRGYTPYKNVGDFMYNAPVIPGTNWSPAEYDRRRGAPKWQRDLTQEVLGFVANPGYYTPTGLLSELGARYVAPAAEKVVSGMAGDFQQHIADPIKRNARYAKDWYDFVVKGNDTKYRDALNAMDDLRAAEEYYTDYDVLANLSTELGGFPKYKLGVRNAEKELNGTSSTMHVFPKTVRWGADELPMVVEDIGSGTGKSLLKYYEPTAPGAGDAELLFDNEFGSQIYDAGKPMFKSRITGEEYRTPEAVLDRPIPKDRGYSPRGRDYEYLERYAVDETTNGRMLPVQRTSEEGAEKIAKHLGEVRQQAGDKAILMGSGPLYEAGILSGKPGDYEFVAAEEDIPELINNLALKEVNRNGFAVEYNSPILRQNPGSGHNVDIQGVQSNSRGESTGRMAWSLFKTMHPEEYEAQALKSVDLGTNFFDMPIVNPATGKNYTTHELLSEFKAGNYDLQHIVNEALAISKPYNRFVGVPTTEEGAMKILKQDRALSILTNKNPRVKAMARRALDSNARSSIGPNYLHGHEYFPNLDFTNVESNKEFLKSLDINPEGIADDPEMMKNIFDAWFMPRTTRYRQVGNMKNLAGVERAVNTGNVPPKSGSAAGSGRNTTNGGSFGDNIGGDQHGFMQRFPTYRSDLSDVRTMSDVKKLFERTESGYKFTDDEAKIVNDGIRSWLEDYASGTNPRSSALTRKSARDLIDKLDQKPIKTLDELDMWFNKNPNKSPIVDAGIDTLTLSDMIDDISRRVDIPEFNAINNSSYEHKYVGIWDKGKTKAASYRHSDASGWKPFEVGRDFRDFGVSSRNSSGSRNLGYGDVDMLPDEQSKRLFETIYGSYNSMYGAEKKLLEELGAEEVYSQDAVDNLRRALGKIEQLNTEAGPHLGLLKKYKKMPFASKQVRATEFDTGLTYKTSKDRVLENAPRIDGRSTFAIQKEIGATAPNGVDWSHMNIVDYRDGSYVVDVANNNGAITRYNVTQNYTKNGKTKWVWSAEDDLPFAYGGLLNRFSRDKILKAIESLKAGRK